MRSISFSQANLFNQCGKAWAYRYLDKAPELPNPFMAAGREFHSRIEHHLTNPALFPGTPDLEYAASIAVVDGEPPLVEYEVTSDEPDVHVRGFVDAIATYGPSITVIDWKTSQRKPAEMKPQYRDQLSLYTHMYGCNGHDTIMLVYPQYQIFFEERYDPGHGQRIYNQVVDTAREIETFTSQISCADEVKGTPSRYGCKYCSFANICPDSFENQKKRLKVQ